MKEILLTCLKGPFAQPRFWPLFWRLTLVVSLTLWTQVGGLMVWPSLSISVDNIGRRQAVFRWFAPVFSYLLGMLIVIPVVAGWFGMRPLPCFGSLKVPLEARTTMTCLSGRHFVQERVYDAMMEVSEKIQRVYPKVTLHYFDASFPFRGLPLFPHWRHTDGLSVDMSLVWKHKDTNMPVSSPSPVGYFGYSQPTFARQCPPPFLLLGLVPVDLRHDLNWFQSWLPDHVLDHKKTRALLGFFLSRPDVEQIVLEPHLIKRMEGLKNKLVKNKCDQARHDDHFQIDFRPLIVSDDEIETAQ